MDFKKRDKQVMDKSLYLMDFMGTVFLCNLDLVTIQKEKNPNTVQNFELFEFRPITVTVK